MKTLLLLTSLLTLALSQDNLMPMSKCLHNCALCANNEPALCSGQEFVQCVKGYAGDRCQLRPAYAKEVVLMGGAMSRPDVKGWEDQTVMKCGFRNSKMEMSPVYLLGLYQGESVNQVQIEVQPYFQNYILYFNLIRDSWTPYSDLMRIAVLDQQDNILAQHYIEFTQRQEIHPKKQLFRCNNDPLISQKYQIEGPLNPEVHQKLIIKWEGMLYSESVWGLTNVRVVFGCARGLVDGGMGCAGCGEGYWRVRDREENVLGCEVCPVGCRACVSATQCTSCEEGLTLSSGKCTNKYLSLALPTPKKSLTCHNTSYQLSTPSQSSKSQTLTLQFPSVPAHKKFRILFNLAYHSAALSSGSTIEVSINGMKQKGFGKDLARPLREGPKYLCQGFGDGYFELFKYVSGYFQHKEASIRVQLIGRKGEVFGVSEVQFQYEQEEIPKKEEPKASPKQQKPVMPSPIIPKKEQKPIQLPKKEEQKPKQLQMTEQKPRQAPKSEEKPIQAPKTEEKPKDIPKNEQKAIQTPKQAPKTEKKSAEPSKSEETPKQSELNQNPTAKEPEKPTEPVKQEKNNDNTGQKAEEIKERPAKNSQNSAKEGQKVQRQPVKEEGKKSEPISVPKQNSPSANNAKLPVKPEPKVEPKLDPQPKPQSKESNSKQQPQPQPQSQSQPTIPSPPSSKIPQFNPFIFPIPSSPSQIAQSIQKLQKNKWNIKIGLKTGKNLILCLFYPIQLEHFPYFTAILQSKNLTIIPQVIDKNKQEQQLHFDLNFSLVSQTIDIYMQERPPSLMGRHLQTSPSPAPSPTNLLSSTYIKRYDHIPEQTWYMIEQFATFFTIIAWTTIIATIILAFLGYSVIMQKFSLGLQLAFLHVYVFTEYLPGNFKGIVGGLQRMENLDYLHAGLAGQIEGWLLGNVVQYSPPKFTTFNTDINFTRAVYPCLIINIAYTLWFLALKLIKSRIEPCHQPSTPTESSHQPLNTKLKLFLLRLSQRSLSFWHQILQYQYLTLFWSACLQFHNISYPPDSNRSHIPNLIFCITVLGLAIVGPVLLMFYLQRVYGKMDYFQYGYWFEGVFWMGLPRDRLPGSQHRIDVLVRNFRYQLLVVFFAFLGDFPIQCLVLSITIHTLYLLYQKLSNLEPHPPNFLFTLLEHLLLISLGIGLLIAYAISDKVQTQGYMILGIVLVVLVLLIVVNGVARVCYGVAVGVFGEGVVGKERSSVSQDDKEDKEVIN